MNDFVEETCPKCWNFRILALYVQKSDSKGLDAWAENPPFGALPISYLPIDGAMNIAFWNIGGNDVRSQIKGLVEEKRTDILILIENEIAPNDLLLTLNTTHSDYFYCPSPANICEKIHIFAKNSYALIEPIYESKRFSARRLIIPQVQNELLLVAVHYQSKMNWSEANQAAHASTLKAFIEKAEAQVGHDKTIVLGDFNMNPFEYGMVQTTGLHAVMDRQLALEGSRVVDDSDHKYFYNPMWSFFGEQGKGDVHGSYYFRKAEPICYFWNIFDQVILRPSILELLDEDSLEIVTQIQDFALINAKGRINNSVSDHLPIVFSLRF